MPARLYVRPGRKKFTRIQGKYGKNGLLRGYSLRKMNYVVLPTGKYQKVPENRIYQTIIHDSQRYFNRKNGFCFPASWKEFPCFLPHNSSYVVNILSGRQEAAFLLSFGLFRTPSFKKAQAGQTTRQNGGQPGRPVLFGRVQRAEKRTGPLPFTVQDAVPQSA